MASSPSPNPNPNVSGSQKWAFGSVLLSLFGPVRLLSSRAGPFSKGVFLSFPKFLYYIAGFSIALVLLTMLCNCAGVPSPNTPMLTLSLDRVNNVGETLGVESRRHYFFGLSGMWAAHLHPADHTNFLAATSRPTNNVLVFSTHGTGEIVLRKGGCK